MASCCLVLTVLGVATACLFPPPLKPAHRVTQRELDAYCAVLSYERAQGRTFAATDSIAKREHVAVKEAPNGSLTCVRVGP